MKTLWIVSGGYEAVPGIKKAKEMGLYVVVSDKNKDAPGFNYADDKVIASTYDVEETVEVAKKYHNSVRPIDGVISIASDVPMTVASIADELGLPGISKRTAELATEKYLMKQCFVKQNIAVPWFSYINTLDELLTIADERGFPLVIKPVDSRGARGVLRLLESTDLNWAFNTAMNNSPSNRVMVEEFVEGPQISTEAIVIGGKGYTLGFCDRNYEYLDRYSPYLIENGGTQPSRLSDQEQEAVANLAVEAGRALGVTDGVVKGDMVLSEEGPKVIEIAPRLSGGWFCTDQIPLHTGVDFVGVAIKIALGEKVTPDMLQPKLKRAVAIRYFFPPTGYIEAIPDIREFKTVPGVYKVFFFLKEGEVVNPVTDHTKRAGCVITYGEGREEAINRAMDVVSKAEAGFIIRS